MKAIVQDQYGSPDVLALEDIAQPVTAETDVLVRVHAASVNVADWLTMYGRPYVARPAFGGLRRPNRESAGRMPRARLWRSAAP
jgi:NADPH:quinone reductase-like Zn-dependent oxidoreductase